MLSGMYKIYKYRNDKLIEVYEQPNIIIRVAKEPHLGSLRGKWILGNYLEMFTFDTYITIDQIKELYYNNTQITGGDRVLQLTVDQLATPTYSEEGWRFTITTKKLLGPYNLTGIYIRWIRYHYEGYYYQPLSFVQIDPAIVFSELDSYIIQYSVMLRW